MPLCFRRAEASSPSAPPKPRGRPGPTICYSLHVSGGKTPFVSLSLQRIRAWLPAWWINSEQSRRKIGQTGADMGFCIHKDDCRIKANLLREGKPCWPSATALPRHAAANRPTLCVCVCMFFFLNCAVNGIEIGSMAGFGPVEEGKRGGRRSSARDMSVCVCLCVCETE